MGQQLRHSNFVEFSVSYKFTKIDFKFFIVISNETIIIEVIIDAIIIDIKFITELVIATTVTTTKLVIIIGYFIAADRRASSEPAIDSLDYSKLIPTAAKLDLF